MDLGFWDEMGFVDPFDATGHTENKVDNPDGCTALYVSSCNTFWGWCDRNKSLRIARIGVVALTPLAFWLAELGLSAWPLTTPVDSRSVYASVWQAVHAKRTSDAIWDNMIAVSGSLMVDWHLQNINTDEGSDDESQSVPSVPLSSPEEKRPDRPGDSEMRRRLREILRLLKNDARHKFLSDQ